MHDVLAGHVSLCLTNNATRMAGVRRLLFNYSSFSKLIFLRYSAHQVTLRPLIDVYFCVDRVWLAGSGGGGGG